MVCQEIFLKNVRIKEEFEKFQGLDQAIEKYKQEAVNVLTERKQSYCKQ